MRWLDGDSEMKFFSKEKGYDSSGYREFRLYNVRTGTVFCKLKMYDDDSYDIETLEFFNEIKDYLYFIMRDTVTEEAYSYDRWILPMFRQKKLEKVLK